jgi:radical SAM superfamily enzyme YgiQ (UPF0313 family)
MEIPGKISNQFSNPPSEQTMPASKPACAEKFLIVLIKPSHYDDDGYVIQWWRGWIPANSPAALYGLALDARRRQVLGAGVDLELEVYDEINTVLPLKRIIRRFRQNGLKGLVCLVGVQSNQFARAVDIGRMMRRHDIQVVIGGFHVSGCVSMLPEMPPELKEAAALGISLFAGEAEGRMDELLRDAYARKLKPLYNFVDDLPGLEGQPLPYLESHHLARNLGNISCFDAGRGCPFNCSFCTIINVQGRKSRYRSAADVEGLIRAHPRGRVRTYFITDDDFVRNRNWEPILDRIIELREKEGYKIHLTIQVDTQCHKIPRFIQKAARAGCKRVFIGLESINEENLKSAAKRQNKFSEYRTMLRAWREAGVMTYAGYIIGFPNDTPESLARDIRIIQRELPVDILEFFVLTPLPGSRDHRDLYLKGVEIDSDMNRYDTEHVTTGHPLMTRAEWQSAYEQAWRLYYSPEHIETLIKRAIADGISPARLTSMIFTFYTSQVYEKVHPLQSGVFRRKRRSQRRPNMKRESALLFYPRRAKEIATTYVPALLFLWRLTRLRHRLKKDPATRHYTDLAIGGAEEEAGQALDLDSAKQPLAASTFGDA